MRNTAGERELIDRMQAGDMSAVADLSLEYGARIHQLAFLSAWRSATRWAACFAWSSPKASC